MVERLYSIRKIKIQYIAFIGILCKNTSTVISYFNDLLKFESGKNIDEYFESKRLEMAKSMLLDSNNTVSVVTEKLGYPNIRYFSRLFKRITGVAPNNYRLSQN
ncbi:helix-turn-helix domain-containing protein [Bacteroides fragilis]